MASAANCARVMRVNPVRLAWEGNLILAMANLALARGWLGKPGCGLLPLCGHSNVRGVGSMGVVPELKQAFEEKMHSLYDILILSSAGMATYGAMEAAYHGKIDAALMLGGNLFASNPERAWAAQAM